MRGSRPPPLISSACFRQFPCLLFSFCKALLLPSRQVCCELPINSHTKMTVAKLSPQCLAECNTNTKRRVRQLKEQPSHAVSCKQLDKRFQVSYCEMYLQKSPRWIKPMAGGICYQPHSASLVVLRIARETSCARLYVPVAVRKGWQSRIFCAEIIRIGRKCRMITSSKISFNLSKSALLARRATTEPPESRPNVYI